MPRVPAALERVIAALARLPGVGEKTATRFAFHILEQTETQARDMASAIAELHTAVGFCERCFNLAETARCPVCTNPSREGTICVVEGIQELIAIERTGEYGGRYHVLGGVISPVRGIGPSSLTIDTLLTRIEPEHVDEVIIATNVDVEGEATALYIQRLLKNHAISVSRIATGVPMGGELEYLDQVTLARALRDRRAF